MAVALGGDPELVTIKTAGDRGAQPGDKSRFVKEIEDALLAGEIDLAVHSAKDLPGELPDGILIAGVPEAEDARDALIGAQSLDALASGARVGSSSLRRKSQLLATRADLEVVELSGNVDTRLRKLEQREYDAIVLALAGLRRLGREREVGDALSIDSFVPAAGQGILAIEARADDRKALTAARALTHAPSQARLEAERALVAALEATCHTPVGAHARIDGARIEMVAYAGTADGRDWITDRVERPAADPAAVGRELAERMLAAGARQILAPA